MAGNEYINYLLSVFNGEKNDKTRCNLKFIYIIYRQYNTHSNTILHMDIIRLANVFFH